LAFIWSRVRSCLYIWYSRAGFGWPLHGAGLWLALTWSRVRAGLYMEQGQVSLFMKQGYG
jgi:hypothetical protein